jgi:hypothetical protein
METDQNHHSLHLQPRFHSSNTSFDLNSSCRVCIYENHDTFLSTTTGLQQDLLTVFVAHVICELHDYKINWSITNDHHGRMPRARSVSDSLTPCRNKGANILEIREPWTFWASRRVQSRELRWWRRDVTGIWSGSCSCKDISNALPPLKCRCGVWRGSIRISPRCTRW